MRHRELLASLGVVGIENDHLGRQLVGHVVPSVVGVVVDLEHLVGHRRKDLVYLEQICRTVHALGVDECQREVTAWAGKGLPDAVRCVYISCG